MTFLAVFFSTLIAHEGAHALMARCRGLRVKGIVICRKGIGVRREAGTARDTVWIALAGPAANLILAAALWQIHPFSESNLVLGIACLLPLPSSDGLRAFRAYRDSLRVVAIDRRAA